MAQTVFTWRQVCLVGQVDHCCVELWKQTQGRTLEISCQVVAFHSTTMDFFPSFLTNFSSFTLSLLSAVFTPAFIYKHTEPEPCEFVITYSLGGNTLAEGIGVCFECEKINATKIWKVEIGF